MPDKSCLGLTGLCRWMIVAVLISVPFRNVFISVLGDRLGIIFAEMLLVCASYVALQILLMRKHYVRELIFWLRTLDVQIVVLYAVFVLIVSLVHLPDSPYLSILGMAVYLAYVILFGLTLLFFTASDVELTVKVLIFVVFPVVSVGAVLSLLSNHPLLASSEIAYLGSGEQTVFDALRATSFTGSSLHLGLYNAMLLPLVLGYILNGRVSLRTKTLLVCVAGLGIISLIISFSRGAWLQTAISVVTLTLISRRGAMLRVGALFGLGMGGLLAIPAFRQHAWLWMERFRSILDWSNSAGNTGRILIWKNSLERFLESYLMGFGPSTTGNAPARFGLTSVVSVTESSYLKLLLELGLVGFALFALLYCKFSVRCFRLIRLAQSSRFGWMPIAMFSSLVGLAVEMAIYQSIETQIVQCLLWFQFAAILILSREAKSCQPAPEVDTPSS